MSSVVDGERDGAPTIRGQISVAHLLAREAHRPLAATYFPGQLPTKYLRRWRA